MPLPYAPTAGARDADCRARPGFPPSSSMSRPSRGAGVRTQIKSLTEGEFARPHDKVTNTRCFFYLRCYKSYTFPPGVSRSALCEPGSEAKTRSMHFPESAGMRILWSNKLLGRTCQDYRHLLVTCCREYWPKAGQNRRRENSAVCLSLSPMST